MIRPNGAPSRTACSRYSPNVAWLSSPVSPSVWARDLDVAEDLRVLDGDGHLGREQLDELELLGREQVARPEPLDGQHADGPVATAQRDDDEAAVDGLRPRGSG